MRRLPRLMGAEARSAKLLWQAGLDTSEIAAMLLRSEAQVYNSLAELAGTVDRQTDAVKDRVVRCHPEKVSLPVL
jgi:hypothetical protein